MEFAKPITQNLKKFVKSLQTRKERETSSMFVAEGNKLCGELLSSSYSAEFVVLRSGASEQAIEIARKFSTRNVPVYIARKQQFDQITDAISPQEILAVVNILALNADYSQPFIVLDGINDPGNLGTIIRTADWFGFHNLILSGNSADRFNAKTVRSTMGSLFRTIITQTDEPADFIRNHYPEFRLYGASLQSGKSIEEFEPDNKFGIVMGSEAHGISAPMLSILTDSFLIPGRGGAESLNVAVSFGIVAWHFSRKFL